MAYIVKRRRVRGRKRTSPLGDWSWDDVGFALFGPAGMEIVSDPSVLIRNPVGQIISDQTSSTNAECLEIANAKTAELDGTINDLAKNWNPTGFYSPAQVEKLVDFGTKIGQSALDALAGELQEWSATADTLTEERAETTRVMGEGEQFRLAAGQARAQGIEVIDAPALRRWVLRVMGHASHAMTAIAQTACLKPSFVVAFQIVSSWTRAAYDFIKTMVEVAAQAGKAILKVPDALGALATVLKIGAIGGLAWFLYSEYEKRKGRSS